jgi:O-succinylbenzoate synthase
VFAGTAGWGEFSPFEEYKDAQCVPWLNAALEAASVGWPHPLRDSVAVNATVPAVGPEQAFEMVRSSGGCRTAKVKVAQAGQSAAEEADRVAAVRDALGARGEIRIDANGAWDLETAVERLELLNRAAGGLQYAEQPCRAVADLARLRRRTSVPIAADESIRLASDPLRVSKMHAADVIVLKVQPLGGVRACLEIASQVPQAVVVSSALETSVGLAAGLALAACLETEPLACGLATAQLLTGDLVDDPLRVEDGAIRVPATLAPMVSPQLWRKHAADAATTARWLARFNRVVALGGKRA